MASFRAEQIANFLKRMADTPEGDGSLLDDTVFLYGSSYSNTHNNRNYPLVVAAGEMLGFKHGQFLEFKEDVPLSKLFVTMMKRLGYSTPSFVDRTV